MRALLVVAHAPTRQGISGVAQIVEDRLIEQFGLRQQVHQFVT